MYLVKNLNTNPYFNLAAEEYFLDNFKDDVILLWRNNKTVVIGRNQNSLEEINQDYVNQNNIAVVRRLTGGGAVFHDLGNVNFTVIQKLENNLFNNYAHFTKPVCEFLKKLNINAELSGRNDLLIEGMKFSGNAQTQRQGRIMHHGCILFSADVADISGSLKPSKLKIESKSVKSVRSRVTNISSHLNSSMTAEEFFNRLYEYFLQSTDDIKEYEMTDKDVSAIQKLTHDKYETWDWNYGRSPKYTLKKDKKFDFGIVDVRLCVNGGHILDIKIYGDFFGTNEIAYMEEYFKGLRHEKEEIANILNTFKIGEFISGMSNDEFLELLF